MEDPKDVEGALLRCVRRMLEDTGTPALEIYKATGVSPSQQHNIKAGKTKGPSVNAVEALYTFLAGKPLEV